MKTHLYNRASRRVTYESDQRKIAIPVKSLFLTEKTALQKSAIEWEKKIGTVSVIDNFPNTRC